MKITQKKSSILVRISLALTCIVLLGMTTMLISHWISEKTENDSLAINIAGSLRMQSYKIGLMSIGSHLDSSAFLQAKNKMGDTWKHPVFDRIRHEKPRISELYDSAYLNWQEHVASAISSTPSNHDLQLILDQQVILFTPNEEIHLLQIIREASQNAIHCNKNSIAITDITSAQES